MNKQVFCSIPVVVALALVGGCSNREQSSIQRLDKSDVADLSATHSRFDSAEDPGFTADTHFAAGMLAESQSALGKAVEQYREALKIDPRHQPSLYRLGVLYTRLRDYPNAISTWNDYILQTSGDAAGFGNLGYTREVSGDIPGAEEAYLKGIAKDPKSEPCRINYGLLLARAGRTNEAIIQLQAVLGDDQVHYNLARVYEEQNKRAEAKAEYRKALELNPALQAAQARLAALD